jgi:hypothetical protein
MRATTSTNHSTLPSVATATLTTTPSHGRIGGSSRQVSECDCALVEPIPSSPPIEPCSRPNSMSGCVEVEWRAEPGYVGWGIERVPCGGVDGVSYYGVGEKETRRSLESMGGGCGSNGPFTWSWTMGQQGKTRLSHRQKTETERGTQIGCKKKRGQIPCTV